MRVGTLNIWRPVVLLVSALAVAQVLAPLASAQYATRAEQIQARRQQKLEGLSPEQAPDGEQTMNTIEDKKILERLAFGYHGLTLVMGGLGTGQGFAFGPQYLRTDLAGGEVTVRGSARYALSKAYLADAVLSFPRLADEHFFLEFAGTHRNYPTVDYYGPGSDSREQDRTHFRLEDTSIGVTAGVRPFGALEFGIRAGALLVNIGKGNDIDDLDRPRTEDFFDPADVVGLDVQTDFLEGAVFARVDYRDNPLGARSGGHYLARLTYFDDRDLDRHDFRRLELEAQQYVPFFNKRRVIALRAKTLMSFTNGASRVPFYMQPVLGGSDDLRGFLPYRFYGDNLIVANVEYRWESFTGLDMALFFDAGKVTDDRSELNFDDLETSFGLGFRFNVNNSTFIRLDAGYSREGIQIWFKFANPW